VGVDDGVLWSSFTQQKCWTSFFVAKRSHLCHRTSGDGEEQPQQITFCKLMFLAPGDNPTLRCKIYSTVSNLVRFDNKYIFFYFEITFSPTTTMAL
jgi:hypothetical protein